MIEHWLKIERDRVANKRQNLKIRPSVEKVKMEAVQAPLVISLFFLIPAVLMFIFENITGRWTKQNKEALHHKERKKYFETHGERNSVYNPAEELY